MFQFQLLAIFKVNNLPNAYVNNQIVSVQLNSKYSFREQTISNREIININQQKHQW